MGRLYAVVGDESRVEAWSTVRLPFEPKGWLREYRSELQNALRSMRATAGSLLYAEYAPPEPAFVDLENVLLYNIGSGCYSHLAREGVICRRTLSNDGLHHVSYVSTEETALLVPSGTIIARGQLTSMPIRNAPAHWWFSFRRQLEADGNRPFAGQFGVVADAGLAWRGGLAPSVKSLLDGLVAALHVHDGSHHERVVSALNDLGDGERLWGLLNNREIAVLGERRLARPHGDKIAWNPADERCGHFALVRRDRAGALAVAVVAL